MERFERLLGREGMVEENRASVCISPTVPQVWAYAFQINSEDLDEELAFVLCAITVMYKERML